MYKLNDIEILHKLLNDQIIFNSELDKNNNNSKGATIGSKNINQVALLSELINDIW